LGDVTAWVILAAIVVVVRTTGTEGLPLASVLGVVLFVAGAWLVRRPLRRQAAAAFEARGGLTHALLATLVALALAGAAVTQALGLHALFGAFFVGFTLSTERRLVEAARERLEGPWSSSSYRSTSPSPACARGWTSWSGRALGARPRRLGGGGRREAGGSALAARVGGVPWRQATALGVLMNTRGLMELVILNVGLDLGVLSPALFAIFVLMALLTTLMTSPLLSALVSRQRRRPPSAANRPPESGAGAHGPNCLRLSGRCASRLCILGICLF